MSEKQYKAIKYIRLPYADSKDKDGEKDLENNANPDTGSNTGKDKKKEGESDSVTNQRKLLDAFVEKNPDIEAVAEKWTTDGAVLFSTVRRSRK